MKEMNIATYPFVTNKIIEVAGCFPYKCGHFKVIQTPLVNNDERLTLKLVRERVSKIDCWEC